MIIRTPDRWDALAVAADMRKADLLEVEAFSGREPFKVLMDGIDASAESYVGLINDEPLAMWGVVGSSYPSDLAARVGVSWLLTTNAVDRNKFAFWTECKRSIADLLERWDALVNVIDCRHEAAIRWARRLGFFLYEPQPFGVAGLPFQRFVVTKELLNV